MTVQATTPAPLLTSRERRQATRTVVSRGFMVLAFGCTLIGILALSVLTYEILRQGAARVSVDFLTSYPSRFAEEAGFKPAIWGSIWVMAITGLLTIPIGMGAAITLFIFPLLAIIVIVMLRLLRKE